MKKLKLEEIKLYEAFEHKTTECALCNLEKNYEEQLMHSILGERVMDLDFYPKIGAEYKFCSTHIEKLNRGSDKLGLAIMLDKIINEKLKDAKKGKVTIKTDQSILNKLFKQNKDVDKETAVDLENNCFICSNVKKHNKDMVKVLVDLWIKDSEFRELYKASNGFCNKHHSNILEGSSYIKSSDNRKEFIDITNKIHIDNLERLQKELQWFIKKFDYLNADAPWGTSKDSVQRALQKLLSNY
jgi:hypothetical protein